MDEFENVLELQELMDKLITRSPFTTIGEMVVALNITNSGLPKYAAEVRKLIPKVRATTGKNVDLAEGQFRQACAQIPLSDKPKAMKVIESALMVCPFDAPKLLAAILAIRGLIIYHDFEYSLGEAFWYFKRAKEVNPEGEYRAMIRQFPKVYKSFEQVEAALLRDDPNCSIHKVTNTFFMDKRLRMVESPGKGRTITTRRRIYSWEILLTEKAYSIVLDRKHYKDKCAGCFIPLDAAFWPCSGCREVKFCGVECQEAALRCGHRHECGLKEFLYDKDAKGVLQTVNNILSRIKFTNLLSLETIQPSLIDFNDCAQEMPPQPQTEGEQQLLELRFLKTMLTMAAKPQPSSSLLRADYLTKAIEVVALILVENDKNFEDVLTKDMIQLIELAYNCLIRVEMNQIVHNDAKKNMKIGLNFALLTAMFKHSCTPVAMVTMYNDYFQVAMNETIASKAEVTINYGATRPASFDKRQEKLWAFHGFICRCKVCHEDVVTASILADCPRCHKMVVCVGHDPMVEPFPKKMDDIRIECYSCKAPYPAKKLDHLVDMIKYFDKLVEAERQDLVGESYVAQATEVLKSIKEMIYTQSYLFADKLSDMAKMYMEEGHNYRPVLELAAKVDNIWPEVKNGGHENLEECVLWRTHFGNDDKFLNQLTAWIGHCNIIRRDAAFLWQRAHNRILNRFYRRAFFILSLLIGRCSNTEREQLIRYNECLEQLKNSHGVFLRQEHFSDSNSFCCVN